MCARVLPPRPMLRFTGVPADFAVPAEEDTSTAVATSVYCDFARTRPATQKDCADVAPLFYTATPATMFGASDPMVFTVKDGVFRAWQGSTHARLDLTTPTSQLSQWLVTGVYGIDTDMPVTVERLVQCVGGTMDTRNQATQEAARVVDKLKAVITSRPSP